MSLLSFSFFTAARPAFCAAAAGIALVSGIVLLVAPQASALLGHGPWPPLHARCVAVMALSLAAALMLARRALDPAAMRIPLTALAVWALASVAAALRSGAPAVATTAGLLATGAVALLLARVEGDPPAPAQHADTLLLLWAALAAGVALLLLIVPADAARHWPWRLGPGWVAQYAPLFGAWGVAAALAARERRRYVRTPVIWGLLAWAAGTLAVSLWHAAALRWAEPAAWAWVVVLAGAVLVAAQRLGLHRGLGLWSRDSRTAPPRQ